MNWTSVNFDWNQVRAFLATVEEGSLSAAARALGQAQPTLGRQVAALEEALGVVLFERAGKALVLTETGLDLLDHVRAMRDAADRISLTASGRSQAIDGQVRITASDAMSAYALPPIVARLREIAPGIEIDIVSSNVVQDLRRREADIAIRHVRPNQPDLIARLVRETTAHFYASSSYLERFGKLETLEDLSRADFIGFEEPEPMLRALKAHGVTLNRANFRVLSDSGVAVWEMVKQGLGVSVMVRDIAELTSDIVQVVPQVAPIPVPIWLTTHRELNTNRRIRVVFDALAEMLR